MKGGVGRVTIEGKVQASRYSLDPTVPAHAEHGVRVSHPIVTDEERLLAEVKRLLDEEPWVVPPSEADIVAELVRLRDEIQSAKAEDQPALLLQYNQHHAVLEQIRASRESPQVDPDSPYFAHLRLREGGRDRDVCLGKATRIEKGIRIVDWRNAPISRLFYRYQQGDEYEEEMAGRTLTGEVVVRRTVTIRKGELQRIDAPEGTFVREGEAWRHARAEPPRMSGGQGRALRAHAMGEGLDRRMGTEPTGMRRRTDKHLPDIAGLLDPDQFDLITQPSSGFVVIRGTAGSGKTTVALHRIAWLAFEDPSIDSGRTLFVVFSPALREYVGHVLPALGVHRASLQTWQQWARRQTRRHFPRLPSRIRQDTPADVMGLKLHPATELALRRQVQRVKAPANVEQVIDDWISVQTDPRLLRDCLDELAPGSFSDERLERAILWMRDRTSEVVAWLEGDREGEAALDAEDHALLLRAWQLRIGPLTRKGGRPLRYRHIAIDEVQDFSPIEVRVLIDTLDRHQSITLAGDTQQHVMQEAGFTSWAEFFGHLGLEGVTVHTLRVAYRSARPIVEFAQALLGELREDDTPPLVTRDGPEVELFRFTDHGATVAFLADALRDILRHEPHASVALLTPDPTVSATYFQGLKGSEVPHLRRVTDQDFTFAPGIEITEVAQAKGLEFDYVVLVEVSAGWYPDSSAARRVLHVGATRAIHQLWLTSVGTPSAIIREVLGDTSQ